MSGPLSTGAVVGIAVAGVLIIFLVVAIFIFLTHTRNKSYASFDPHNFIDRPKSKITFVNRRSKGVGQSALLDRHEYLRAYPWRPRQASGVWQTRQSAGFKSISLVVPQDSADEFNEYQPVGEGRASVDDFRISALSNVSADLGGFSQLLPRTSLYIRNPSRLTNMRGSSVQIRGDGNHRISRMSPVKYQAARKTARESFQTFNL